VEVKLHGGVHMFTNLEKIINEIESELHEIEKQLKKLKTDRKKPLEK